MSTRVQAIKGGKTVVTIFSAKEELIAPWFQRNMYKHATFEAYGYLHPNFILVARVHTVYDDVLLHASRKFKDYMRQLLRFVVKRAGISYDDIDVDVSTSSRVSTVVRAFLRDPAHALDIYPKQDAYMWTVVA